MEIRTLEKDESKTQRVADAKHGFPITREDLDDAVFDEEDWW